MKKITSRQNPDVIAIAKLGDLKQRKKQNRYLAEGLRTISTLLESQQNLQQLFVTENRLQDVQDLVDPQLITLVAMSVIKKISHLSSPSGIAGIFELPQTPSIKSLNSGIVLTHVTDPGNMGTLIRTCAAMGKKTVVVIEGVDPWNPKVVQASAGTIGLVNIFQLSWQELISYKKDLLLAGLVVSGGTSLDALDLKNALLVIGSEAHGIPQNWLSDCDTLITLPMPGGTESLNAAVAGSIVMYEAWKKNE